MRRPRLALILAAFVAAPAAFAGESSWYLNAGVGYSKPSYYSALQSYADASGLGASEIPFQEYVGGYYRVAGPLLVGLTIFASADMYVSSSTPAQNFTVISGLLGASAEYYALGEPGSGLFVRADLGSGTVSTSTGLSFFGGSNSQGGLAWMGALGGAFKLSPSVSLEAFAGYFHLGVSGGTITAVPIDVGVGVRL